MYLNAPLSIKILSIIISWISLGLPINNLFKLTAFSVFLVLVIYGKVNSIKPLTVLICGILLIIKLFIPQVKILETNNIFLLDENNATNINFYQANLPPTVFNYFKNQFNTAYLATADCSTSQNSCWKAHLPTIEPFNAFSADSFWQNNKNSNYSRIINSININNRFDAKIGTFNDLKYNFFDPPTNNIYREKIPFFIIYQIPKELVGMQLYWQGNLLWPTEQDYQIITNNKLSYKTITASDVNKKIYLSGINANNIKVFLNKTIFYKCCDVLKNIITIIILITLLSVFNYTNKFKISLVFASMLWQLLNIAFFAKPLLQGLPILEGGGDGLVFYGYARTMLQHLIAGHYLEVLRGVESSFYFMPGLRYLRLIELIIFGDNSYGYLLFLLFIPVIVFNFLRNLFSIKATIILISLFFIPWLKYFGFSNVLYIKFALTGYSEAFAYGFFLLAISIMLNCGNYFFANLLLALAVFLRPNLAIISGIMIIWTTWQQHIKNPPLKSSKILINLLGFSPVFFMLWHNVYFAGEWSLFTGNKSFLINLITPPITYLKAGLEIINGHIGNNVHKIQDQLHLWNRAIYFFRWPAILSAIYCLYSKNKNISSNIKIIAILGLISQLQLLFFNAKLRYSTLAWNFCFLTMVYYFIHLLPTTLHLMWRKNIERGKTEVREKIYA